MDSNVLDKKRLIVVVPSQLADNVNLAVKIKDVAQRLDADILYLALAVDPVQMLKLSHCMATMRRITKGTWVIIVANIVDIPRWEKTLRQIHLSQDLLLVASEQNVKSGQLRVIAVRDFLRTTGPRRDQSSVTYPTSCIAPKIDTHNTRHISWFASPSMFRMRVVLEVKSVTRYP